MFKNYVLYVNGWLVLIFFYYYFLHICFLDFQKHTNVKKLLCTFQYSVKYSNKETCTTHVYRIQYKYLNNAVEKDKYHQNKIIDIMYRLVTFDI